MKLGKGGRIKTPKTKEIILYSTTVSCYSGKVTQN